MLMAPLFGLGVYTTVGGAIFKSLVATLTGIGLMLGSGTILVLPSSPKP